MSFLKHTFFMALLSMGYTTSLNAPHDAYAPAKTVSATTQTVTVQEPVQIPENTPSEFEIRTEKRKKFHTAQTVFYGSFFSLYLSFIAIDPFSLFATAISTGIYYAIDTKKFSNASNAVAHQSDIETYFVTVMVDTNTATAATLEGTCPQEISEKTQLFILEVLKKNPEAHISIQCRIKTYNNPEVFSLSSFSIPRWNKSSHTRKFTTLQKHVFRYIGLKLENQFVVTSANRLLKALAKTALTLATFVCAVCLIFHPFAPFYFSVPLSSLSALLVYLLPVAIIGIPSLIINLASLGCMAYYGKDLYWF